MIRAAAWTCGLFAVGGGVVHFFPGPLTEPLVLLVLGSTLFLVSGRAASAARAAAGTGGSGAPSSASRAVR